MTYYGLIPYVFRRFSLLTAPRTGLETALHYLKRNPLPPSDKPALFTMNIMPPMMTVWHHLARKNLGNAADIVIFDCSGKLKKEDFPGARVQKFLNLYAATKSDEFLRTIATHRDIGWICDDDMFLISPSAIDRVKQELGKPNTATLSFRPRSWWHFEIDGKQYEPSASYCLAINRKIVVEKEHLSLRPGDGNTHVSLIGKPLTRFDTFDKANETLLKKGYRCAIVPADERENSVIGYSGMSSAVMLLWYFTTPEQLRDYLLSPPDKAWQGTTLFTILAGLLALSDILEMHEKIAGAPYVLRSMLSHEELLRIRAMKERLLRTGNTFSKVDEVSEKLKRAL
ncbi:hypothetical protein FJZ28_00150 [Candidatus Peregrinibacteria bacterium]|nr:hypothetical protein [Candidatus Peregrinibacteria bacterium]